MYTVYDTYLIDCVERLKPEPIPPSDVITNIGQNATFHCAADFGCKSSFTRDVSWYIGTVEVQDVSTRYIVTEENRYLHEIFPAFVHLFLLMRNKVVNLYCCVIN